MPEPRPPVRGRPGSGPLLVLATLCLLLAAACGTKGVTTGSTTGANSPTAAGSPLVVPSASNLSTRPSTPAQLAIIYPTAGATVTGTTLNVQLTLADATLVPPGTTSGVNPSEGHIHLSLDGEIVSMTSGLTYAMPVSPGPHILQAEFVGNDHLPFYPRKLVSVMFTDVPAPAAS